MKRIFEKPCSLFSFMHFLSAEGRTLPRDSGCVSSWIRTKCDLKLKKGKREKTRMFFNFVFLVKQTQFIYNVLIKSYISLLFIGFVVFTLKYITNFLTRFNYNLILFSFHFFFFTFYNIHWDISTKLNC